MAIKQTILYSYLMGVDAIDQTICPEVLGMTKCSIARGQRPNAIEHWVIPSTEGQIQMCSLVYCIHTHYITILFPN